MAFNGSLSVEIKLFNCSGEDRRLSPGAHGASFTTVVIVGDLWVTCVLNQNVARFSVRVFLDHWTCLGPQEFFPSQFLGVYVSDGILSVDGAVVHMTAFVWALRPPTVSALKAKGVTGNIKGKYRGTKLLSACCCRHVI